MAGFCLTSVRCFPRTHPRVQTQHEGRLYTLRIHCGEDYPDRCPSVRFVSKLNMGCVDQRSGEVVRNRLQVLAQWNRNYGIEQVGADGMGQTERCGDECVPRLGCA